MRKLAYPEVAHGTADHDKEEGLSIVALCTICGLEETQVSSNAELARLGQYIESQTGFRSDDRMIRINGVCTECLAHEPRRTFRRGRRHISEAKTTQL